jgi:hypothetical protein
VATTAWIVIRHDVFPFVLIYPLDHMDGAHYVVSGLGYFKSRSILGTLDKDTARELSKELDALAESMRTHNNAIAAQAKQAIARAIAKAENK